MDQEFKDLLKEMQKDIRNVSEKVIEISALHRQHEDTSVSTRARLEKVEHDLLLAKGAINTIRSIGATLGALILTSGISFCVWIVSANFQLKQDLSNANKDIAILNMKLVKGDINGK